MHIIGGGEFIGVLWGKSPQMAANARNYLWVPRKLTTDAFNLAKEMHCGKQCQEAMSSNNQLLFLTHPQTQEQG